MKSSAKKIELASVDDLFSTEESRADAQRERVLEIPLSELHPFKNHPFKVKDDEAMLETADSIKQYGVLVPAIARPDPEGGYELVAGHRRHRASELAEKETMPVIVRDLDDDAATIIMVDSNLQRESLLPSERAFAYKMKLEAMKHQGERVDLTCAQVGHKSDRQKIQRYGEETISLQLGMYANNQRLYIGMITHTEDGAEAFADMTVNLPGYSLDPGEAFISGDISKDLLRFIKENKLGKVLPYQVQSGYGKYSAVAFDLEKLKAFDPKGVAEFREEWNLPDKKPVKKKNRGMER